jgi:hypothetical protein
MIFFMFLLFGPTEDGRTSLLDLMLDLVEIEISSFLGGVFVFLGGVFDFFFFGTTSLV